MEIKPEYKARLDEALARADMNFWNVIADRFPEAKTGDFAPDAAYARNYHNSEDVLWWLRLNAPELMQEGG